MSLDGEAYVAKWGKEAAEDAPAFGRIREMGIPFALARTAIERRATIHGLVSSGWLLERRGRSQTCRERNILSREEALRAYTSSGAWISNEEDRRERCRLANGPISLCSLMTISRCRQKESAAEFGPDCGRWSYRLRARSLCKPRTGVAKGSPDWLPATSSPATPRSRLARATSIYDRRGAPSTGSAMIAEAMPSARRGRTQLDARLRLRSALTRTAPRYEYIDTNRSQWIEWVGGV